MVSLDDNPGGNVRGYPRSFGVLPSAAAAAILAWGAGSVQSALWCYPAVLLLYLVLSPRAAGACSLALTACAVAAVGHRMGAGPAIGVAIPLGLVIVIVSVMLNTMRRLQRQLAEQAITDPLTGAFNRRQLEASLTTAIERRNRTAEPSSLLFLDIDHFKHINDAFGHAMGDDVLKRVVQLVAGRMRTLDALFRVGGEEFALLLSGARYAEALLVAEDVRVLIDEADLLSPVRVSISVGVSELQYGQSAHGWIADADAALYRAKRGGRNRVAGQTLASAS